MSHHDKVMTSLITKITSLLKFLGKNLHLVGCATLCAKSEVMLMKALVVPRGYSWAFTIRPNDLREDRLPRDITEGIHWLVSTRYLFRTRNSTYQFLVWGQNNVQGQNVKKCSFELFQIQNRSPTRAGLL